MVAKQQQITETGGAADSTKAGFDDVPNHRFEMNVKAACTLANIFVDYEVGKRRLKVPKSNTLQENCTQTLRPKTGPLVPHFEVCKVELALESTLLNTDQRFSYFSSYESSFLRACCAVWIFTRSEVKVKFLSTSGKI